MSRSSLKQPVMENTVNIKRSLRKFRFICSLLFGLIGQREFAVENIGRCNPIVFERVILLKNHRFSKKYLLRNVSDLLLFLPLRQTLKNEEYSTFYGNCVLRNNFAGPNCCGPSKSIDGL